MRQQYEETIRENHVLRARIAVLEKDIERKDGALLALVTWNEKPPTLPDNVLAQAEAIYRMMDSLEGIAKQAKAALSDKEGP